MIIPKKKLKKIFLSLGKILNRRTDDVFVLYIIFNQ